MTMNRETPKQGLPERADDFLDRWIGMITLVIITLGGVTLFVLLVMMLWSLVP